jgi:membrane-associated phospholipid phosphatase
MMGLCAEDSWWNLPSPLSQQPHQWHSATMSIKSYIEATTKGDKSTPTRTNVNRYNSCEDSSILIDSGNDVDVREETKHDTSLKNWFNPGDFRLAQIVELGLCAVVYYLGYHTTIVISWFYPHPYHDRPIPVQHVETDYVRDFSKNEPFNQETIPEPLLLMLAVVLPMCIQILLVVAFLNCSRRKMWFNLHATLCVYMMALSITHVCTSVVKRYVGYLRPIFFAMCNADETYSHCTASEYGESHSLAGLHQSFPSGHASTSFCGLSLLACFLHARFGMGSVRSHCCPETLGGVQGVLLLTPSCPSSKTCGGCSADRDDGWKVLQHRWVSISALAVLPCGLALYIAASRVHDNKHFPADVIGGSVLGSSIAIIIHSLWFR